VLGGLKNPRNPRNPRLYAYLVSRESYLVFFIKTVFICGSIFLKIAQKFSKMHKNSHKFTKNNKNRVNNSYFAGDFLDLFRKTNPIAGLRLEARSSHPSLREGCHPI